MKNIFIKRNFICLFLLFSNIAFAANMTNLNSKEKDELYQQGVSAKLAQFRKANISNLKYELWFSIPKESDKQIQGSLNLSFVLKDKNSALILDFKESPEKILQVFANNKKKTNYRVEDEHIIIDADELKRGANSINIKFIAGEQSLNRRKDFLYTLLVPDRARTLFPCFDQPDLKAIFELKLSYPSTWKAISNTSIVGEPAIDGAYVNSNFSQTKPISTYLFSFVVGDFKENVSALSKNGSVCKIYHRETDSLKIAQLPEIASQVSRSLDWLEEYTGIPYPFSKYDLILIPGFQYGGMEHMGATLYNSDRMFLSPNPTIQQELSRSQLIAHETAHMWFGDYVTMKWFSQVWIKEVFANFFAALMVRPFYPNINHYLADMDFYTSAYAEDRTLGSNAIEQELTNLRYAGLIYGNIIYQKSPVVMNILYNKIGEDNFRLGIQEYLKKYAYSNAGWDELIEIFSKYYDPKIDSIKYTVGGTSKNLTQWSHNWVNEKAMPCVEFGVDSDTLALIDRYNRDIIWQQDLKIDTVKTANANMYIPNLDGKFYGFIKMDSVYTSYIMNNFNLYSSNPVGKLSLLITLNENYLNNNLDQKKFLDFLINELSNESDAQMFPKLLSYISGIVRRSYISSAHYPSLVSKYVEKQLWNYIQNSNNTNFATQTFRTLSSFASGLLLDKFKKVWKNEDKFIVSDKGDTIKLFLSSKDFISLSYTLAIKNDNYKEILDKQRSRITNVDKLQEFDFISRACSHLQAERDALFNSLLKEENRAIEPWVGSVLSILNSPIWQDGALKYIEPALAALEDVQKTGDIFFPKLWISSVLSGHHSKVAAEIVANYLNNHPQMLFLLKNKVLQSSGHLDIESYYK